MAQHWTMRGHLYACITIFIWGTTFIATKLLLKAFQPMEILFFRFSLGLVALFVAHPHRLKGTTRRQEGLFALAGLCGVTLYYLLEHVALTYTSVANVGVIVSVAPFFTALLAKRFLAAQGPGGPFYLGFVLAILGIGLISFSSSTLSLNPLGDLLTLLAAMVWACYAVLSTKISQLGFNIIQTTRRIFGYGLLFMVPALPLSGFQWDWARFAQPINSLNMLFLGLGASALCFVSWNVAVKRLGAVKTSLYIYLVPVITVVTSVIILKEQVTWMSGLGTALALAGLFVSEKKGKDAVRSTRHGQAEHKMRYGH